LRVFFEDESFVTIPALPTTTALALCDYILKKRNIQVDDEPGFALFACEISDERAFHSLPNRVAMTLSLSFSLFFSLSTILSHHSAYIFAFQPPRISSST
jgi:hypothetical protein